MSDDRRYVWADDVLWRHSAREVVVLPSGLDDPIRLTATGIGLWAKLGEPRSLRDIAELLAAEFGANPTTVVDDIGPVLAMLRTTGAIRAVPS